MLIAADARDGRAVAGDAAASAVASTPPGMCAIGRIAANKTR